MARATLRRALSLSPPPLQPPATQHPEFQKKKKTPRVAAAFASTSSSPSVVPLRSPLDDRLLRLLRTEITYLAERCPPYPPPSSFKSFAMEDRPGEQWVRLRAAGASGGAEAEEVTVEATMFDGAAEPVPDDAPLFRRVESLERGPRLHLSLIVEVTRGDRVLGFICFAWPDDLAVRHVLTLSAGGSGGGGRGGRDFGKLGAEEREAVTKFLEEREVDDELAGFLHDYMANKEEMELLRWLKTIESFLNKYDKKAHSRHTADVSAVTP